MLYFHDCNQSFLCFEVLRAVGILYAILMCFSNRLGKVCVRNSLGPKLPSLISQLSESNTIYSGFTFRIMCFLSTANRANLRIKSINVILPLNLQLLFPSVNHKSVTIAYISLFTVVLV